MNDNDILELYWDRDERAISETELKYGALCRSISFGILSDKGGAEECVNDSYMRLWNSIPPERPASLCAYLCRICRNLSIDRYNSLRREKRGGRSLALLDELSECIPTSHESEVCDRLALKEALDRFLASIEPVSRSVFMKRYWFCQRVKEISRDTGLSVSAVKMSLMRSRKKLKKELEKEGFGI